MNFIEITTNIGCPNGCDCCPQSTLKAAYDGPKQFQMEDFRKCLDHTPPGTYYEFCGFSEPMLHPRIAEMLEMTSNRGFPIRMCSTLLGIKDCDYIWFARAKRWYYLRVHVPDDTHFLFDSEKWIELHKVLWNWKLPLQYTHSSMGKVPAEIQRYLDSLGVEVICPKLCTRAGILQEVQPREGQLFCTDKRVHQNILLPNGDVYLCCMDWGLKHKLGNLITQPYSEIHAEAHRLAAAGLEGLICSKCEYGQRGFWTLPFGKPKTP